MRANEVVGSAVALPMWRLLVVVVGMMVGPAHAKPSGFEASQRRFERVEAAFRAHRSDVEKAFGEAHAVWPPSGLFLRAYKQEGLLELWANKKKGRGERVKVKTFTVCAKSGELGPKVESGDGQVPEGVYRVDRFNPRSSYHLSLGLDYPNAVDRARAAGRPPGGDIFIHGGCVTIGCLPLTDGPVEWLYVAAVLGRGDGGEGKGGIDVHVFPCRFGEASCEMELEEAPDTLQDFWDTLRPIHAAFEKDKVVPPVVIDKKGYRLRSKVR